MSIFQYRSIATRVGKILTFLFKKVFCAALVIIAIVIGVGPSRIGHFVSSRVFANILIPNDHEYPRTAFAIPNNSGSVQSIGGQGIGLSCSLPWGADTLMFSRKKHDSPVSLQYRQACAFHDYCYRHGAATYGYTQADCDYLLLEHTIRLCKQINSKDSEQNNSKDSWTDCMDRAKLVALGVRLGGNVPFKRTDSASETKAHEEDPKRFASLETETSSSYFEFDPYPVGSPGYTVYRIADAPNNWPLGATKALYQFEIRPSGTRLTISGRTHGGITLCAGVVLPGDFNHMNVAPNVLKFVSDTSERDKFVWWRRYKLSGTGGNFAELLPSIASIGEWRSIFPGATAFNPKNCSVVQLPSKVEKNNSTKISDKLGEVNLTSSYFYPYFFHSRDDFRLISPVICASKKGQVLCYSDFQKVSGSENDDAAFRYDKEPYIVRDNIYDHTKDQDAYRSFVSSPFLYANGPDPIIAMLRRGESDGRGYGNSAFLRRQTHRLGGKMSEDFGILHLTDFGEENEPVSMLGQDGKATRLFSFTVKERGCCFLKTETVVMKTWVFPEDKALPTEDTCKENNDNPGCYEGKATATPVTPVSVTIENLDKEWLVRPPAIFQTSMGAALVAFTKIELEEDTTMGRIIVGTMKVGKDGNVVSQFKTSKIVSVSINSLFSDKEKPKKQGVSSGLRTRPVILSDIDQNGKIDLILPSTVKIAGTLFAQDVISAD